MRITMILVAQTGGLTEVQNAVRDYFQQGGSIASALFVLLGIVIILFTAYYLTHRRQQREESAHRADPEGLWGHLLQRLDLTPDQQQWLATVAKELRLTQPTVILLSPVLFQQHLASWQQRKSGPTQVAGSTDREWVAKITDILFPSAPEETPCLSSPLPSEVS